MLTDLRIANVVTIDALTLNLASGFLSLTGETGAGKSILLDALGLALGQRSEARLVRQGCEQASVTATFDNLNKDLQQQLHALAAEQGLEAEAPYLLRRTLGIDGKSRAFFNDQPVSIAFLKSLGNLLVEIHGQFDNQTLLDASTHRDLLDRFGGLDKDVSALRKLYAEWKEAVRVDAELLAQLQQAAREQEYWQDVAVELRDLNPQAEEEDQLVAQRSLMMHAEKLISSLDETEQALTGHKGARDKLNTSLKNLERSRDKLDEALDPLIENLNRALIEIEEAVDGIVKVARGLEYNQNAQAETDERLFALRGAARKYQKAVVDLPQFWQEVEARIALIADQEDARKKTKERVVQTRAAYAAAAEKLHDKRASAALKLAKDVKTELGPLKLDKAQFVVDVASREEAQWSDNGMDAITFLISANPGTPPGPLHKMASGGEMARFMLALKVVTQKQDATATLIFDEVDTGVGGAVAEAIGRRLHTLGDTTQVFAVTHSPQVAAKAHAQWKIMKEMGKNSTRTMVHELSTDERIEEIARMLSGATVTAEARATAAQLLDLPAPGKTTKKAARA